MESMSSSNSATSETNSQSQRSFDKDPLWKHVTKLVKMREKSGNAKIRCNICDTEFTGSYSRVRAHLLKIKGQGVAICQKVTPEMSRQFQREVVEAEERQRTIDIPLPPPHQTQSSWGEIEMKHTHGTKRKAVDINNPIHKAYNMKVRAQVDSEIARAFYSGGLPFHFAINPHYIKSYTLLSNSNISSYVPPTYNALRTVLLQKEMVHIERLLEPIKTTWKEKCVTIVSDGWSDSQRRPLINFMAVTESGPMFLKVVNCEGEYKDKFFIANLIKEVILEVGPQNVVQVITDNAHVCKAAGMIIETMYPRIFWTPCVVYTLNLALKNICASKNVESNADVYLECHWITEVVDKALMIKNYILNHNMLLTMYNQIAHLKLLSVAETRFTSVLIMLKRFKLVKRALETLVLCDEWSTYREYDPERAQSIRSTVLDELWWDKIDYILELTAPIYDMLYFADTDRPLLHFI